MDKNVKLSQPNCIKITLMFDDSSLNQEVEINTEKATSIALESVPEFSEILLDHASEEKANKLLRMVYIITVNY